MWPERRAAEDLLLLRLEALPVFDLFLEGWFSAGCTMLVNLLATDLTHELSRVGLGSGRGD